MHLGVVANLLPLQGALHLTPVPRALPWANGSIALTVRCLLLHYDTASLSL